MSLTTSVSTTEASLPPLDRPQPRHHLSSLDSGSDLLTDLTSLRSASFQHPERLSFKVLTALRLERTLHFMACQAV